MPHALTFRVARARPSRWLLRPTNVTNQFLFLSVEHELGFGQRILRNLPDLTSQFGADLRRSVASPSSYPPQDRLPPPPSRSHSSPALPSLQPRHPNVTAVRGSLQSWIPLPPPHRRVRVSSFVPQSLLTEGAYRPYFSPGLEPMPLWKLRPATDAVGNAFALPQNVLLATAISSHLGTLAFFCTASIFFYNERYHHISKLSWVTVRS